jgi:hypothetical protein
MKKLTTLFLFLALTFLTVNTVHAQFWDTSAVRLTTSNSDRNPVFKNFYKFDSKTFELMAFERAAGDSSKIMVTKLGTEGALDSGITISHSGAKSINPAISYYSQSYHNTGIVKCIVAWETNINGNWDIYASIYDSASGWSQPVPIDSSPGDQHTPHIMDININEHAIVYESNGDIIYIVYNISTNTFVKDTNLTPSETYMCRNPLVSVYSGDIIITYEKEISPENSDLYYHASPDLGISWDSDTLTHSGSNRNGNLNSHFNPVFESNRSGKWGIYKGRELAVPVLVDAYNNYSYYQADFNFGLSPDPIGYITDEFALTVKIDLGYLGDEKSFMIGDDTTVNAGLSLSSGVFENLHCSAYWFAFDKEPTVLTAEPPGIYGVRFIHCLSSITGNSLPAGFSLHQNYPNPFNPRTSIAFDILTAGRVKLLVYDIAGKEIITLASGRLHSGSYEYIWDAAGYPSGVYYYKLIYESPAGTFAETKKMVLIK